VTLNGDASPETRDVPIQVAIDFVNTLEYSKDSDTEHLPDPSSLIAWLAGHGLLDEPEGIDEARRFEAAPSEGKKALADARSLRGALRHVVDARVHATVASPRDLDVLNRWLRIPRTVRLVSTPTGLSLVAAGGDRPLKRALGRLADAGARAVATEDPDRLRTCANEDCRWAFYDTSRTGRRKWCDMASCGNRAKARRHRERRGTEQPTS
jgi:predicted RNA-binding Zn ribbon-like protein